ncbi:glycosyltransferase family 87 protein [Streptomyces sp. NPDC058611]|uniref:glycosyltransferase family 87 protein n=1 Tax=unclassified Streptomyces TaxID=2593676 RepID=UPI00365C19B6
MTRSTVPSRLPPSLPGMLFTGSLLALGVLCVALRVPPAHVPADGVAAADWRPPAAYPPFAAILFTPAAWLPAGVLEAVVVLGSAGLLALLILLSCRLAGLRARRRPVLAATVAGLWLDTLTGAALPGQVGLAAACLVLWDLGRPGAALGKGFALGIGAGTVLTAAALIPYLLLTQRARAGLTAAAALAGTALLGLLVLPEASDAFWTRHLPTAGRALLSVPGRAQLWVWCVPLLTALIAAARGGAGRTGGAGPADRLQGPVPAPRRPAPGEAGRTAGGTADRTVSRSPGSRRRP